MINNTITGSIVWLPPTPAKASFQMNARTDHGDIESDFGELKIESADRESKAAGSVGAGGTQVRLTNSHGDINIRKTG